MTHAGPRKPLANRTPARGLEQGQVDWRKAPTATKTCLVDPHETASRRPSQRVGDVQCGQSTGRRQETWRISIPKSSQPRPSISTRQYSRLVSNWITSIGLDANCFGTHSLRRTKATLIYRRTGNLRAVQLLLGHRKVESTVRYLGIEVDDALAIAEQVDF